MPLMGSTKWMTTVAELCRWRARARSSSTYPAGASASFWRLLEGGSHARGSADRRDLRSRGLRRDAQHRWEARAQLEEVNQLELRKRGLRPRQSSEGHELECGGHRRQDYGAAVAGGSCPGVACEVHPRKCVCAQGVVDLEQHIATRERERHTLWHLHSAITRRKREEHLLAARDERHCVAPERRA
eukprot:scaffold44193_cov76-Phaeocystis_antarctica.AAC.4